MRRHRCETDATVIDIAPIAWMTCCLDHLHLVVNVTSYPVKRFIVIAVAMTTNAAAATAGATEDDLVTVAEPPLAVASSAPADPPTITDPIDAAYNRFLRLRDEGRTEEATAAALQVAMLNQERHGLDSMEIVTPLINLAVMQSQTGDLRAAEQNYRTAIGVIESNEGIFSPRLINPLSGLGHAYNRAGMYEQAIDSFERALRLNNIELGFINFQQFGIQDGLTESYVGLRELEDANFYQQAQVEIHQRKFGRDDPKVAPSLYKLAEWYSRIGNLEASALAYRKADRILRDHEGDSSESRADALLGLARLYERQGNRPAAANTLRKGLAIIDQNADADVLIRARVQVALGDLYIRENKREPALAEYGSAWWDLSSDPEHADERDFYFKTPVRIAGMPFPTASRKARGQPPETLADGSVVIRYTIDGHGRAQDIVVVESEPAGILEDSLVKIYRRSAYRPRLVDGVAVPTENLLGQHDFQYLSTAPDTQEEKPRSTQKSRRGRIDYPGSSSSE